MNPIRIVGVPFDEKSSFMAGAAEGPDQIRAVLNDGSSNFWTETGVLLEENVHYKDVGNISIDTYPDSIESAVAIHQQEGKVIVLGGDHSIAYPIVRSLSKEHSGLQLLQFDAHTDLYDNFEGDRYSHACPFARILEEGLISQLTQVGIRTFPESQLALAKEHDVKTITMRDWFAGARPEITGPLYISLDLDVFDPGFAPGVSHHEPGGVSPREILELLMDIDVPILGADIVELNPRRYPQGITAMLGAKLLKELIGKMWTR